MQFFVFAFWMYGTRSLEYEGSNIPDPVVDVDVCQAIAEEVVKERDVQKSTLDPVALCVAEHKVQSRHEEDVEGDKEEEGVVSAGSEGVGKED